MRDKSAKFKELAQRRVNRTLHALRLVANLANRNNYEYTEEDTQKIIVALEAELKAVKSKFAAESKRHSAFKL